MSDDSKQNTSEELTNENEFKKHKYRDYIKHENETPETSKDTIKPKKQK